MAERNTFSTSHPNLSELELRGPMQNDEVNQRHHYENIYISGNAKVQLGDSYYINRDIFEVGSKTERLSTLMNVLCYDGQDDKYNQVAAASADPASFSWIDATQWPKWLSSTSNLPFWIKGKPGSGKSTLMKHLSETKQTRDNLNRGSNDKPWVVIHFFFDYRSGTATANNIDGMMNQFLRQVVQSVPSLAEDINERYHLRQGNKRSSFADILSHVAQTTNICAFIDGLDEYEGDLWDLCVTLLRLRDTSGMKMCLASRPEKAFETYFTEKQCPTITLQHHNRATIESFIRSRIEKFSTEHIYVQSIFTPQLQEEVVDRARGVILWARIVTYEMIQICSKATTTTEELQSLLENLPTDLEPLYERVLGKTNAVHQDEAALVLHFVVEHERTALTKALPVEVVFQATEFLQSLDPETQCANLSEKGLAYPSRLKGLLGNLIDLSEVRSGFTLYSGQVPLPKGHSYLSIRLLHKSLSIYLQRSSWTQERLTRNIKDNFPNHSWRRLAISVIERVTADGGMDASEAFDICRDYNAWIATQQAQAFIRRSDEAVTFSTLKDFSHSKRLVDSAITAAWLDRRELLNFVLVNFYELEDQSPALVPVETCTLDWPVIAQNYLLLHYFSCDICQSQLTSWWQDLRVCRLAGERALETFILSTHERYLSVPISFEQLEPRLRDNTDLLDLLVFNSCSEFRRSECEGMIKALGKAGSCLQKRQLCGLQLSTTADTKDAFIMASNHWPLQPCIWQHDKDCPLAQTSLPLFHHWLQIYLPDSLDRYDYHDILKLYLRSGERLEEAFSPWGTVFHAILNSVDNTISVENACKKFIAAAKAGASPNPRISKYRRALTVAKFMRLRCSWRRYWPYSIGVQRPMYLDFIDDVITALELYETNGSKWPNLDFMLQKWRVASQYPPDDIRSVLYSSRARAPRNTARPTSSAGTIEDTTMSFDFDTLRHASAYRSRRRISGNLGARIRDYLENTDMIAWVGCSAVLLGVSLTIALWRHKRWL